MGLFGFLWRLLGGSPRISPALESARVSSDPQTFPEVVAGSTIESGAQTAEMGVEEPGTSSVSNVTPRKIRPKGERRKRIHIDPLEYQPNLIPTRTEQEIVRSRPYRFASIGPHSGEYLDLSQDSDPRWLEYYNLPLLKTPDDLADWLGISIGKLAWLTHRTTQNQRPETEHKAHYAYRWIPKRNGGWRLIEAPKLELKQVQRQILRDLLNHVPTHEAAHGFVLDRSIITNATPHVGQRFVLKFDLKDFYTNVRYSRVVSIFRSLGYSREVAIWLARLTTSSIPWNLKAPVNAVELAQFSARHLPQGGVTSPSLANLSAFSLDVRLSGLASAYRMKYTRYADDLTFSGPGKAIPALHEIVPLIRKIIRSERFYVNPKKQRILRNGQRQSVTGVIVNERVNISRVEFDRLKAILTNCMRNGPSLQNRDQHPHFQDHLRGRIAHVCQLNQNRGEKLLSLYHQIDWSR